MTEIDVCLGVEVEVGVGLRPGGTPTPTPEPNPNAAPVLAEADEWCDAREGSGSL
jgi:hypothetical protein